MTAQTPSVELQPALGFSLPFLADAFAAGFQGYFVPVGADARAFEARVRTEHVHLGDSYVAVRDGHPVALALTSRRGDRSRMAALGVVPELRGAGLGRRLTDRLIDDARARGDRTLVLECIEGNAAALALYTGRGFRVQRRLVGWDADAFTPSPSGDALHEVSLSEAVRAFTLHGDPGLPWQLAPETIAGMTLPTRGFRIEEAHAVVTPGAPGVQVLRGIVVPPALRWRGIGRRMMQALAGRYPGSAWKLPAIVPETLAPGFFGALGFRRSPLSQVELTHLLDA